MAGNLKEDSFSEKVYHLAVLGAFCLIPWTIIEVIVNFNTNDNPSYWFRAVEIFLKGGVFAICLYRLIYIIKSTFIKILLGTVVFISMVLLWGGRQHFVKFAVDIQTGNFDSNDYNETLLSIGFIMVGLYFLIFTILHIIFLVNRNLPISLRNYTIWIIIYQFAWGLKYLTDEKFIIILMAIPGIIAYGYLTKTVYNSKIDDSLSIEESDKTISPVAV
jgi:hypothetical protein